MRYASSESEYLRYARREKADNTRDEPRSRVARLRMRSGATTNSMFRLWHPSRAAVSRLNAAVKEQTQVICRNICAVTMCRDSFTACTKNDPKLLANRSDRSSSITHPDAHQLAATRIMRRWFAKGPMDAMQVFDRSKLEGFFA